MHRLASVVLVVALAGTASAQSGNIPSAVQPGARVRVSAPRLGQVSGRVVSVGSDSLVLVRDRRPDTLHVAAAELQSLDVSVAQHRRRWRGAGLGFLAGATFGAVFGLATYEKPKDCAGMVLCDLGPGFDAMAGAILFGGIGTVTGAIVGGGKADDWKPVELGTRTSLELFRSRSGGHPLLGLALRF